MNKGSVGLGLATRPSSTPSLQKQSRGKSAFAFIGLSLFFMGFSILAPQTSGAITHHVIEKTAFLNDITAKPAEKIATTITKIQAIWDVQKSNEMLAAENQRLMEWYMTANRLDAENKALRELLNMNTEEALSFKSAKVMSDAATQYSHTILVRMGENNGLTKGQGVLSHEGLIGRVIETGQETSRVLLMSDVNSRIPVTIEGSKDRAILAGTNNGDPLLDHLPETHAVIAGQNVVTSGHGGIFPYGIPVGETYLNDDGDLAVRPFADANRASHVQVVDYGVPAGSATRATASAGSSFLR